MARCTCTTANRGVAVQRPRNGRSRRSTDVARGFPPRDFEEKPMADDHPLKIFTRRDLLKGAGLMGAGAVSVSASATSMTAPAAAAQAAAPTATPAREAFETLTAAEADLLEAVVARLIPSDQYGPGAKEARVAHYIDRALAGALSGSRQAYTAGLAALDRYATITRGKPFVALTPTDQDSVLID